VISPKIEAAVRAWLAIVCAVAISLVAVNGTPQVDFTPIQLASRRSRRAAQAAAIDHEVYTLDEFCDAHRISRATFYNLQARGEAPDAFRAGTKVLISKESAARWRKARTAVARLLGTQPEPQSQLENDSTRGRGPPTGAEC
jgi:hypothetical protein